MFYGGVRGVDGGEVDPKVCQLKMLEFMGYDFKGSAHEEEVALRI